MFYLLDPTDPEAFSRRLCLGHRIAVFAIHLISIPFARWRVTFGLLLGGLLSLLNFSMLRSSAEAVIAGAAAGKIRKFPASRFVLRYVAVGSGILLAYWLNIISVPAA